MRRMVTNVHKSKAEKELMCFASELDAREGLRIDDARDGPDLVDDDLAEDVEVLRLDFRDQVVFSKEGVELHDFLHLQKLVVNLVLFRGSGANEHESDSHPWSPPRETYCCN